MKFLKILEIGMARMGWEWAGNGLFMGYLWALMGFSGLLMGYQWALVGSGGLLWALMGFDGL
jgi:hypothetical protein